MLVLKPLDMMLKSTQRSTSHSRLIDIFIESFYIVVVIVNVISGSSVFGNRDHVTYNTGWSNTVETVTPHPCSHEDSFRCFPEVKKMDAMQECVPAKAVCDHVMDCSNGWDESVEKCGCMETEFQCNATTCIDRMLMCDTTDDCLDGKDEMGCEEHICQVSHTKCDNHFCVPRDKLCDFVDDCGDGSDEILCERPRCFSTQFRCNNSECVSMARLCDGVRDCIDGSDEEHTSCAKHIKCPFGNYVSKEMICDGWVDCKFTHQDELDCGPCKDNQYSCPNGRCIKQGNVCDGICDCLSCQDEDNCAPDTYPCINEEKYLCRPPHGKDVGRCIDKNRLCDKVNDCRNSLQGSDEYCCSGNCSDCSKSHSMYVCGDGRCIHSSLKCNGFADCMGGDDEDNCQEIPSCPESQFQCRSGQCVDGDRRCDASFDCKDRTDEADCDLFQCSDSQDKCQSGQCIASEKWCDFFRDCPDGSDERQCYHRPCQKNEFQCSNGQCIDMTFKCQKGEYYDVLFGCDDKSHLFNCSNFECGEDQFKCREGYCIDKRQKCDGNVDCEFTNWDEDACEFPCPRSKVCLCKDDVMDCDNRKLSAIPDLHKQEKLSTIKFSGNVLKINQTTFSSSYFGKVTSLDLRNNSISVIPEACFATMYRLALLSLSNNKISRLDAGTFKGLSNLKTIHLTGNRITFIHNDTFLPLLNLRNLDLSGQELTRLWPNGFNGLKRVLTLNLANNKIHTISPISFGGLVDLISLDLSGNDIRSLDYGMFLGMPSLEKLYVSSNKIVVIAGGAFNGMPQLRTLDLSLNLITDFKDDVFVPIERLEKLTTDHYKFCCLAGPYVQCLPEPDEFSSCEDLMSNHMLRISIWILGVVALLGNMAVILWRLRDFRGGRVHSFLITNLAIGDLLMGVYLLIIASVDLYYRGAYIIHDEEWRRSDLCRFAGFVSTFSSELSVLTLTTITLDRLLCILFPLKRTRLGLKQAVVVMALIWSFVFLIAITPVFGFEYFQDFYGRSGVCLALHITPDRPAGWEYSVAIFLVLNFTSFLVIAVSYLWMFIVAKKTRSAVRTSESPNDTAMARRMTIIVMTDFCCWVPIILLGFVSLAGARTDNQVYAWIAVFVLPLNSATNPVLYTLSTAPFLGNVRKRVTVFRKSFINSIEADTKHSYVEDRTTHYYYDKKSPYRQLELIRLRSLNNTSIGCYSRENFVDT